MRNLLVPTVDVTVVMPCYNRSTLILRSLESLRAQQTWPRQVIVVDDASSDDSVKTVRDWAKISGFPVIVEELAHNGGVAAARNRGIQLANTTYIAFLDSDDEHIGNALEKLATAFLSSPAAVLSFGDAMKVTPTESIPNAMFSSKVNMTQECEALDDGNACFRLRDAKSTILRASLIPTCATFFRRADALAVGGMPAKFRSGEDWLFWLKLSELGDFIYVAEDLAIVHRHEGNLTHPSSAVTTSLQKLAGFVALLDGSAGIQIALEQRARLMDFTLEWTSMLRYQSSRLGLRSYISLLRSLPTRHRKPLMMHMIEDPKSAARALVSSVRPLAAPKTR